MMAVNSVIAVSCDMMLYTCIPIYTVLCPRRQCSSSSTLLPHILSFISCVPLSVVCEVSYTSLLKLYGILLLVILCWLPFYIDHVFQYVKTAI